MRSETAIAALVFGAMSFAGSASAWHFTPESHNFIATGSTTATMGTVSLPCTSIIHGSINASGAGAIIVGSFKSTTMPSCSEFHLASLPWAMTAISATKASINGATITTPAGSCGPAVLTFTIVPVNKVNSAAIFNQTLGTCRLSGKLTLSPAVAIVAN